MREIMISGSVRHRGEVVFLLVFIDETNQNFSPILCRSFG